jgi:hypothetical protein
MTRAGRQLLHISCRGGFSRSKREAVGINENGLAPLEYRVAQNVESGKQRESAMAFVVVGRRPASLLRVPELCSFFCQAKSVQIAVGRQDPAFMRIKQRLSVPVLSASRPRYEFPKYTHSPIYKVTPETPREPNSSVVSWTNERGRTPRGSLARSAGSRRTMIPAGRWRVSASICTAGAHERLGILGLWRCNA